MNTPRQEFLGPITKLAATYLNNVWVSDGSGIIDGYGAQFNDISSISFKASSTNPSISQPGIITGVGNSLSLSAQNGTTGGGSLTLQSGADTTDASDSGNINLNNGTLNTIKIFRGISPASCFVDFAADLVNMTITQSSTGGTAGLITLQGGFSPVGFGGTVAVFSGGGSSGTGTVILGYSGTPIYQVGNSSGKSWAKTDGYIQLTEQGSVSTTSYTTLQSYNQRLVANNPNGTGSYTINPYIYNHDGLVPRTDKQSGSFKILGASNTNTLTFSTAIHGFPMPTFAVLTGKFLLGWIGNNSGFMSAGGAIEFLITVITDGSGNVLTFLTSLAAAGGYIALNSTTANNGTVPALPFISTSNTTSTFSLTFQATSNGAPGNAANFYWAFEYGWGVH